jgi:hypothetical protein
VGNRIAWYRCCISTQEFVEVDMGVSGLVVLFYGMDHSLFPEP